MAFVALIFVGVSVFAAGKAFWGGEYADGIAIIVSSLMAFAAGSGFRGSLHLKNPIFLAALIGAALLACSIAIMHFLDLTVDLVDGRLWAIIGATVGFLAATKADAAPRAKVAAPSARGLLEDCFAVVAGYGKIIEEHPGTVLPLDKLPLPKDQMKRALQLVWAAVDDDSSKDAIEASFSHLAYFRDDVEVPTELGLEDFKAALETESLDPEVMEKVSEQVTFFQKVNAEALQLASEFEEFKASRAG